MSEPGGPGPESGRGTPGGPGLLGAIGFLTCLGGSRSPSRRAVGWFPLVGGAIGLALGGIWWGAARAWPVAVAAVLVVMADLVLTGMLHFDGLLDAADGLLAPMDRARRLEVMRDPHTGAFGVTAGAAIVLARWAALAAMAPRPLLLAGVWCASRSAMALTLTTVPYARTEGGLASAFRGPGALPGQGVSRWRTAAPWVGLGGILAGGVVAAAQCHLGVRPGVRAGAVGGASAVVAGMVAFAAVVVLARRRLGGFTGDVLGAAGVVGETVGLVVASAHW